ncbi:MAG: hypothetical protein SFV55_03325 [Haliscomenobacter sp.]|uniref:hypothetical protein n=1 Tax=Haliscomenobacter sp. TaxID=2717303 RepID=UPI0029A1C889|nr:hypothetical protein [Haliscomenobacter sp.]MDX2067429.1 hypothetical protein [Haliscomenobacter sp.]
MKIVNVTVRGGNTTEGATGVSFSVLPYEVIVQIPGSLEPVLSVPVLDNPLLNRQSYSFAVEGYEVDLDVQEIYDDCGEGLTEDELEALEETENQAVLNEALGEPESEETSELEEEVGPDNGLDTGYFEEMENAAGDPVLEALELSGEPEDSSIEAIAAEPEEVAAIEAAEPEALAEIPEVIEITSSRQEAPVEEEAETAFFQRNEGGSEPVVDADEAVVPIAEDQEHNVEDLKVLLAQTQDLLKKYDLNSVEH